MQSLSRRRFLGHGLALGLSGGPVASLLTACGGGKSPSGPLAPATVEILNAWGGEEQILTSLKDVVAPFTDRTGIAVRINATRDLDTALSTRLRANDPPDIAILPNPGKVQQLADTGVLTRLDTFLDMHQINRDYAASW